MLSYRLLVSIILKMLLSAISASLLAQDDEPGQWVFDEPGQWVGGLYLVYDGKRTDLLFIDEENRIRKEIPSIKKSANLFDFRYFSYDNSFWHNGALYDCGTIRYESKDGKTFRHWGIVKWEDDEWHYLGNYKLDGDVGIIKAIPCDNNRFIVVSSSEDLTGNNSSNRSPFAMIYAPSSGGAEFRLGRSISNGSDELQKYMLDEDCFALAYLSHTIITDKYVTVLNYNTGLYWIFSLENASLKKAGNIFKKVTPEMIAKGGFYQAILCANPEKSGSVLISAIDEDFFTTETGDPLKEMKENIENGMSYEDASKISNTRHKELIERNPYIVWYRIYPGDGKVERLYEPPEGGAYLRDGGKNNFWRPLPDGSVKMGYFPLKQLDAEEPIKTDQKSDEETKRETSQAATLSIKFNE